MRALTLAAGLVCVFTGFALAQLVNPTPTPTTDPATTMAATTASGPATTTATTTTSSSATDLTSSQGVTPAPVPPTPAPAVSVPVTPTPAPTVSTPVPAGTTLYVDLTPKAGKAVGNKIAVGDKVTVTAKQTKTGFDVTVTDGKTKATGTLEGTLPNNVDLKQFAKMTSWTIGAGGTARGKDVIMLTSTEALPTK